MRGSAGAESGAGSPSVLTLRSSPFALLDVPAGVPGAQRFGRQGLRRLRLRHAACDE